MTISNDPVLGGADSNEHEAGPACSYVGRHWDGDPTFQEMIDRFYGTETAVRREFERLASYDPLDLLAVARFREAAHNLADQVDVLLVRMAEQKAADQLVQVTEETFDSLRELEEQIDTVLKRGRR
ncbi:hypothetical protein [Rubellimicrobium mesophilum]|uniref:hypothetical protein n=1 Tax=Rubellimicrobium mesophilum TaxID=1123067 RepID=UPI000563727C|nr:hypothetical protein [Rubellimicrobium mesophilum]